VSPIAAIESFFEARIDARALALARITVGAAACLRGPVSYHLIDRLLQPGSMRARGYEWIPEITRDWMAAFIVVWVLAAAAFTIGYRTRLSGAVLTLLITYHLLADQNLFFNHILFLDLVVFLLVIADSGAVLSVDWLLQGKPARSVRRWPIILLRLQVSIIYFFAGILKLNPEFLSGNKLRLSLRLSEESAPTELLVALAWATIALEIFLSFALWSERLRPWAILSGVIFHAAILLGIGMYGGLVVFSVTIVGTYFVFLTPGELERARAAIERATGATMGWLDESRAGPGP
jgi:hypothetical protein